MRTEKDMMTDRQKERSRDQFSQRGDDARRLLYDDRSRYGNSAATNQEVSEAICSWKGKERSLPYNLQEKHESVTP